jgi:hypothetical protein
MEEVGSDALIILNENPTLFSSYTAKRFKDMANNAGYEFVADNILDLSPGEIENIKNKYKKFKEHYDIFTRDYSNDYTQSFINTLKNTIN